MTEYKIDPRIYKLFLRLSDKDRVAFLHDLLKLYKRGKQNA